MAESVEYTSSIDKSLDESIVPTNEYNHVNNDTPIPAVLSPAINSTENNTDNTVTAIDQLIHQFIVFDDIRTQLEQHTLVIYNETDRATNARKQLADITKSLKYKSDSDKLLSLSSILKSYQNEINLLTQRCKLTEMEYLKLYKLFLSWNNPIEYLQSYRTQQNTIQLLQSQLTTAQQNHRSLEYELNNVKDQSVTVRNLQQQNQQLRLQVEQLESNQHNDQNATQQINELTELYEIKLNSIKLQLNEQIKQNNMVQQQLIAVQSKLDNTYANNDNTSESLLSELHQSNNKIVQLQQQLDQYQHSHSSHTGNGASNSNDVSSARVDELENELNRLRTINSTISEQQLRTNQQLQLSEQTNINTYNELEQLQEQCQQYQNELRLLPSHEQYTELQSQLQLYTDLTYSTGTNIDLSQFSTTEKVLYNKSQQLDNELIQLRQQYDITSKQLNELQSQHTILATQQTQYLQQITQLQYDVEVANNELNAINQSNTHNSIDTVLSSSKTYKSPHDTTTPTKTMNNAAGNHNKNTNNHTNDSMLQLITQQRNRLRTQIQSYEGEINKLKTQVERLAAESNTMKLDNIKLYEQLQYVKQYNNNNGANSNHHNNSSTSIKQRINNTTADHTIDISAVENKYKQLDDERHNPFHEFTRHNKLNKLSLLPTTERITYTVTKFAMSRKGTRLFVLLYIVLLHIMIFVVLYTHTIHNHCGPQEQHSEDEIAAFTKSNIHIDTKHSAHTSH